MNKKALTYGILAIPLAFLGLPLYIYLPNFYVNEFALNIALVGGAMFVSRLLDMFADPFIGRLSDVYLKKKHMILIGSLLLIIGFYFLIYPLYFNIIWLFIFSLITYIGFSFVSIAYFSLNANLGRNYQDNTRLSFSREVFTILGVLIALILPYIFGFADDSKKSLNLIFLCLFISLPICLFVFLFYLEEKKSFNKVKSFKSSIKEFLDDFTKSKTIFKAFILNNLANAIPATLFLFYVQLVLQVPEFTGVLLILYFSCGVLALPIWIFLSKKIQKHKLWMISMFIASCAFIFVPFLDSKEYIYFGIICIISGLSLGADMALPTSMQADIAQKSSKSGNEITGTLFGFWAMITKFSLAFAVFISFSILELADFNSSNPSDFSLFILSITYSLLPVFFKLFAIKILFTYKQI